jgi:hypothetical protein
MSGMVDLRTAQNHRPMHNNPSWCRVLNFVKMLRLCSACNSQCEGFRATIKNTAIHAQFTSRIDMDKISLRQSPALRLSAPQTGVHVP